MIVRYLGLEWVDFDKIGQEQQPSDRNGFWKCKNPNGTETTDAHAG